MLSKVGFDELSKKIAEEYRYQTEESSQHYAEKIILNVDTSLEPLVEAWVKGEPVPDMKVGPYSIDVIMGIRNSKDFVQALLLLDKYKKDAVEGEKAIWQPDRKRRG